MRVNRWSKLIKTELSALVCVTSAGGYILTGGSLFDFSTFAGLLTGTMSCAASASTFNQLRERNYDAIMARTKGRPLVTGAISPSSALAFGLGTGIGGVGLLAATTNVTTALLGGSTILLYALVYTPMKRITRFNTEVGAVVGAIPPVMGWTAAMGSTGIYTPEAFFLAATLYAWQMHHFMTIAWARRADYKNAGFVMQSLNDPTGINTARKGAGWLAAMTLLPFAATGCGFTNPMFCLTGSAINAYMILKYYPFYLDRNVATARSAMFAGFFQLIGLFGLMTFHMQDRENVTGFRQLDQLRVAGLEKCIFHLHSSYDAVSNWPISKRVYNFAKEIFCPVSVEGAASEETNVSNHGAAAAERPSCAELTTEMREER